MRVVVAEDHALLREGLVALLKGAGIDVVATADSGPGLLDMVTEHGPELAIIDVRLPPTFTDEGVRAAIAARAAHPALGTLILSQYVEPVYTAELLDSPGGGVGYLLKERVSDIADFIDALRRVAAGGTALDREVVTELVRTRSTTGSGQLDALTPRERETLALMAEGRTNAGVAKAMVVSLGAVEKHISNIFARLDLPDTDDDHRRVLAVLTYLAIRAEGSAAGSVESRDDGSCCGGVRAGRWTGPVAERMELLDLLTRLDGDAWSTPTVCPGWDVRDLAVHLLHDDLRRVSRTRDAYEGDPAVTSPASLPEVLNDSNESWVRHNRYISPALLVELLEHTSRALHEMWGAADLRSPSEGVWWAGVELAPVWLDVARDYSEDWTHQQQIRDAVHRPGLTEPTFIDPVLETFLCALPHTYRHVPATPATSVCVAAADGERALTWTLRGSADGWSLSRESAPAPTASITLPADTLWRLASGGISPDVARHRATVTGANDLVQPFLQLVSVVR